ncbi:MAG: type IV pilus twitching motility protein PilT [Elusimicrobiota bacterium]
MNENNSNNSKWHKMMSEMLAMVKQERATDLHLSVGVRPHIRVDGNIKPTALPILTKEECENMMFSIMTKEQIRKYKQKKVLDFSYGEKQLGRFRINIYKQRNSLAAAIRRLPIKIPTIEELGLPAEPIKNFCNMTNGMVIVSGPVGTGKTTTLASMIQYINKSRPCHIITIEDPIEYVHNDIKSMVHQREVGSDTISFASALKYGLREDPDVVLVGEMRDLETISTAVTIAETGHLVLATLHTGSADESIRRIVDVFPADQQSQIITQLSFILNGVVNQVLLPRKEETGRILATEIMITVPAIQSLIRENKIEHIYSHIQMGSKYGMKTMNQSLFELIKQGKVDKEVAVPRSTRVEELKKMLQQEAL